MQNSRILSGALATTLTALAALGALAAAGTAQGNGNKKLPRWKIDPYTKNDPKLMEKLGYVSYGPFEFGQQGDKPVTTEHIDQTLSYAEIIWVETKHFKIGSSLDAWTVPANDAKIRAKIRDELTRLAEKIPGLDPKTKMLNPWLRLHLNAQRMEETYAEMLDWLGVEEEEFPAGRQDVVIGKGRYMGMGPYLGQDGKYVILTFNKQSVYSDYMRTYVGRVTNFTQRWNFKIVNSLLFAMGADMDGGKYKDDTALHCHLVFNVVHNLIDGYRFYAYDLPVWIKEGLAHWFERRVSPRYNSFDQDEGSVAEMKHIENWEAETRSLIANRKGSPFSDAFTWREYGQIKFDDHVLLWSRWDYLLREFGKEKFSQFMLRVKGRVDPNTWMSDQSDLVGAVRDALQDVYGLSPLTFDERWKDWVKANYKSQ